MTASDVMTKLLHQRPHLPLRPTVFIFFRWRVLRRIRMVYAGPEFGVILTVNFPTVIRQFNPDILIDVERHITMRCNGAGLASVFCMTKKNVFDLTIEIEIGTDSTPAWKYHLGGQRPSEIDMSTVLEN